MMDPLYEIVKWSFRWTVFFSLISGKEWTKNCQKNPTNDIAKISDNRYIILCV